VLEAVRRREPRALGSVYDAAFPYVYRLAFRLCGRRAAAEDAAQDVFLKLHRHAARVDPSRHLKPWLTTVTLNACRDRLRRRARRSERAVDPSAINGIGHSERAPEYEMVERERWRALERALGALDDRSREVVVLHVFSGQTHQDTAALLGISPAAVRKRYSRALAKMRDLLGRSEP
jgi:RNA polymerase sigma-70 factor (ECF subfamily)